MAVKFKCEYGNALEAPADRAGTQAKCPACGRTLTIPRAALERERKVHLENVLIGSERADVSLACPHCGTQYLLGKDFVGRTYVCQECSKRLLVLLGESGSSGQPAQKADRLTAIKVVCPNGHRLTAKLAMAGKTCACPTCKAQVEIPIPAFGEATSCQFGGAKASPCADAERRGVAGTHQGQTGAHASPPTQKSAHTSSQSESLPPVPSPSSLSGHATSLLAEEWNLAVPNAKAWADHAKRLADEAECLAAKILSTHMSRRCAECAQQAAHLAQATSQATGKNMAELAAGAADAAEGAALYAEFLICDVDEAVKQTRAAGESERAASLDTLARGWRTSQQVANELCQLCIATEKTMGCNVSREDIVTGDTMLAYFPEARRLPVQFHYFSVREARAQLADEARNEPGTGRALFDEFLDRIVAQIGACHASQQRVAQSRCFIATAVYDSPEAPELLVLRRFRDTVLTASAIGRTFIMLYERCSPPCAHWLKRRPLMRGIVRMLLVHPLASILKRHRAVPSVERDGGNA